MSSTRPPRVRSDLMRMPLSVFSNVQFFTRTLRTPPTVSLPIDIPWPCLNVQSVTVMSSQANSRPFAFLPDLMAMLSSPQSIVQPVIVTRRHMLGSMPSVLGDRSGARIVMPLTVTPSHSVGTK